MREAINPAGPEKGQEAPMPAKRSRRPKLASGTTPPPFEAQKPQEEIEELPQELLKAAPPETPGMSSATKEALEEVRAQVADRVEEDQEWEAKMDAGKAAAEAAEERKKIIDDRSEAIAKAKREAEAKNGAEIANLREQLAVRKTQADLAHQAVNQLIDEDASIPDMTEHAEPHAPAKPKPKTGWARIKAWFSKNS